MKPLAGGMLDDANLAIKWLLQFDTAVPDPGIEKVEEIEEIVEIVSGPWELTSEEQQALERIRSEMDGRFCRRCGYCQPCPQGVQISLAMTLRSLWKRMPPERFRTGWLAEALDSARDCIQCGECEEKCPYHLPIGETIADNLEFNDSVAP